MIEFRGKHLAFLADQTRQIDLEGARYSGKSWVCATKVVRSCKAHPGIFWHVCRYSNETTRTLLKPLIQRIASMEGIEITWDDSSSCFDFPESGGKVSKIYCYGLKAQSIAEALSKVRGAEYAGVWNDQSEETPQQIAEELPFCTRQPGYPPQVIFSPNPPTEDHYLTDMFPEENPFENRVYYCLSLYDNAHNLADGKIKELEDQFPITHAKHKSLILGQRGPNVVGVPVYDQMFDRARHVVPVTFDSSAQLLEAIDTGKHHPVWMVAQRTPNGGMNILGGVMGKRMFLEDFLPVIDFYRAEWFDGIESDRFKLCCDPPPVDDSGAELRYTHVNILREAGLKPRYSGHASAPDVRENVIQHNAGLMRRNAGAGSSLAVNRDPSRWMMKSSAVTKQTKLFVDGLEGSYVWDEHLVSVSNRKVRQPKSDQWVDGWQRCLENIVLNFSAGRLTPNQEARKREQQQRPSPPMSSHGGPAGWMAH